MRVITLNVNGIRSAASKGVGASMCRSRADVACRQEIEAQEAGLAAHR
jgi:exodeoxyribonuclease III